MNWFTSRHKNDSALNLSWCYLTWLKYWNKNQRNLVLTFGSWNQWKNLQVSVLLPWKVFEWWFKFSIWHCVTWFHTTRYFQGISSVRVMPKHDVLGFCVCVCCRNREIFCPRIPDPSTIFKEMMMTGNRDSKVYTWKKSLVKCSFCPHKYSFLHCCVFQSIPGDLYKAEPESTEHIILVSENTIPQEIS